MDDIFDRIHAVTGISKYSSSEVITPKWVVSDMVDLLPADIFNLDAKFLDPAVKSGRFLMEIYRRLMASDDMKQAFSNEQDRREHILKEQLYGFATSPTAATIVRKQLYGTPLEVGNIQFSDGKHTVKEIEGAYSDMKFDVVIGNPPYNKGIDLDFVKLGFDLSKQYTVMITPAKWQTAAVDQRVASKNMDYGKFRKELVPHMSHVCFYPDCNDIFNIKTKDGICFYLLDKNSHTQCIIENRCSRQKYFSNTTTRDIRNGQTLFNIGDAIIQHMSANVELEHFKFPKFNSIKRYRLYCGNLITSSGGNDHFITTDGKTLVSSACSVIDTSDIWVEPSLNSNKLVYCSDDKVECESFKSWLDTKFVRFLVYMNISSFSNVMSDDYFRFVPAPPTGKFDHIYTDQELYDHFKLPQKYRDVIEAVIKERK